MRISLMCVMALAASVSPALAADPPSGGVEVGANLNTFRLSGSGANTTEAGVKAGLIVGGFVSLPVAPMVAIQPEVVYTQKHSRLTGTGSDSGLTVTGAFDFVEIPVLAKLDLTRTKTPGFYVVVGPGFGFTTQAKLTDQKFGTTTLPDEDLKAENKVRSSDVGFIVGAGVTKGKVGVEVRYDAGLRNLNTDNDSTTFVVKERTATILVRWSFR